MTTQTTATSSTVRPLARSYWRTHPTHRYAKMQDAGVKSPAAWACIAARLEVQALEGPQGDQATFCRDRAYDAYQRAGYSAEASWNMTH